MLVGSLNKKDENCSKVTRDKQHTPTDANLVNETWLPSKQVRETITALMSQLPSDRDEAANIFFQNLGNILYSMYTGIAPSPACWNSVQEACCWEQELWLPSLTPSVQRGSSSQTCAWHTAEAEDVTLANASWNGTHFPPSHLHCLDTTRIIS